MIARIVSFIIGIESLLFVTAALAHSGFLTSPFSESTVISESITQGLIGMALGFCAYGIWRRKTWSRKLAVGIHIVALVGALFGSLGVQEAENNLSFYNIVRLTILVLVLFFLFTPKVKNILES